MSGSQKYIKIIGILNIIGGAFYALIGILGFLGKGIVGNEALVQEVGDSSAPLAANVLFILMIGIGVFYILMGVLGVRAGNDASKIGPVFILSVISLVVGVIGLLVSIFGGSFSIYSLIELIPPALMAWCANNVKKQAKS